MQWICLKQAKASNRQVKAKIYILHIYLKNDQQVLQSMMDKEKHRRKGMTVVLPSPLQVPKEATPKQVRLT